MKTHDVLRQMTGHTYNYCDGPLGEMGQQLVDQFQAREATRLADADERAAMMGRGPVLEVLQRKLAEAREAELFDDSTPAVTRFDAYQALQNARTKYPDDRGLRMAAKHAEMWWQSDPMGALALGDVARLREHYRREYPRSVIAEVIDSEIPRVGFNTLPVVKLAQIASQIAGNTEAERQEAYEQVIRAHGLDTQKPEHRRARALIIELASIAEEPEPELHTAATLSNPTAGTPSAIDRTTARLLSHEDPVLRHVGQMVEHLEEEAVVEEIESPNTGEPMVVELEPVAEEPVAEIPEGDDAGEGELLEDLLSEGEALSYYGQLDDFSAVPAVEEPVSVIMNDPTDMDQQLEVTVTPVEEAEEEFGVAPADESLPMLMESARRTEAKRRHAYSVFVVKGGVKHDTPLETIKAAGMPAMLKHVADGLREAGQAGGQVLASQTRFNREALIELDAELGDYLFIQAAGDACPLEPEISDVAVQHNLDLDADEAGKILTEEVELKQIAPKPITAERAQEICASIGLTADKIESRVLGGEEVMHGPVMLRLAGSDVELARGDRILLASLAHLDHVIGDFIAIAAAHEQAASKRVASPYRIKPLFTVNCGRCSTVGEYLMPDRPENVRCASCGWVTPPEAVALQLEASPETEFPGYVITAKVPGMKEQHQATAKRMLTAIRRVAEAANAELRDGQFAVTIRKAGEPELNRIRLVLEDVFGAHEVNAQLAEPPVNPTTGTPPQVMDGTMQPMQPAQPGTELQQEFIEQETDPNKPVASRAHVLHADGHTEWISVRASSEDAIRELVASTLGAEVLDIQGQLMIEEIAEEEFEPAAPASVPIPESMPGIPEEDTAENIEMARLAPDDEEVIKAAMTHYRNVGVGIAEAVDSFVGAYGDFLDRFGAKTSPARHLAEAAVVRISKEVYEKPAITRTAEPKPPAGGHVPGTDWVDLPGAGELLGPDSSQSEGFAQPKINEQVAPEGKMTDPDMGPDSSQKDVGSFGASKPPADGHIWKAPGKLSPTDLGKDSESGDNAVTKKMDEVSRNAPKNVRSK